MGTADHGLDRYRLIPSAESARRRIPEDDWRMIEAASRLLEADGYVVATGAYKRWIVAPDSQGQSLGYTAFMLP
jgi:hypothetical protein